MIELPGYLAGSQYCIRFVELDPVYRSNDQCSIEFGRFIDLYSVRAPICEDLDVSFGCRRKGKIVFNEMTFPIEFPGLNVPATVKLFSISQLPPKNDVPSTSTSPETCTGESNEPPVVVEPLVSFTFRKSNLILVRRRAGGGVWVWPVRRTGCPPPACPLPQAAFRYNRPPNSLDPCVCP